MDKIQAFTNEQLKKDVPVIRVGDTVRVYNKIKEGNRERTQLFEGLVISKRTAVFLKRSQSVVSHTVSVWKRHFRCTARMWKR